MLLDRGKADRAGENLSRISELTQRMGRIIQNLRAFARQESIAKAPVELGSVLQTALDLTEGHRREAGVEVVYELSDDPIWVHGGEVRLSQVFVNLITNAVDAMAAQSQKSLRIHVEAAEKVTVTFHDSGPGIEVPDKVFDPFYTTKQVGETGGMGLGLSISYGIVQSLGGQIRGSNHPDGGAVFSVTLDPAPQEAAAA